MRVDLIAEFFLRVAPTREAVALASQTLGRRAMMPDGIRDLFEGKFASSLRAVAAEMTLEEIHEQRSQFMTRVRDHAGEALAFNGLELENVALVDLDQTRLEHFDPSNAFDAEGLTQLTEVIETRRKMRNQIEQRHMLAIRNQNLDAERRSLEIDRESEYARLEQEREVEVRRAVQRAELARERALREQEAAAGADRGHARRPSGPRIAQERSLAEDPHRKRRGDPAARDRAPPRHRGGRTRKPRGDRARRDRARPRVEQRAHRARSATRRQLESAAARSSRSPSASARSRWPERRSR